MQRYTNLYWSDGNGGNVRVYEHRVFNGVVLPDCVEVHHLDHDTHNNDPSNLIILSRADHRAEHADDPRPEDIVHCWQSRRWRSQREMARHLGVSEPAVSRALSNAGIPPRKPGPKPPLPTP